MSAPTAPPVRTLRTDPGFRRYLTRAFSLTAVFYVLAAIIPITFDHADQHFQTLEFAHFKVQPVDEHLLSWEYHERMRPWAQPALYAAAIAGMRTIGIDYPFTHDRILRLASAALAIFAIILFCVTLSDWLPLDAQRRWLALTFALFWMFPYFHTRTSSENFSSVAIILALSALFLLRRDRTSATPGDAPRGPFTGPVTFTAAGLMLSGLLLGMSFNFRYQVGFVVAGIGLWLLLIARVPLRAFAIFALGVLLAMGGGFLVDWWGYGTFEIVPWRYLAINVFEGRSHDFGTAPWYDYVVKLLIKPLGIVVLIPTVLFWVTRPKNLLTWATVPFVLVHLILAHKEVRFLWPVSHLALAMAVFMIPREWYLIGRRGNPFRGHGRWIAAAFWLFAVVNFASLVGSTIRPPRVEVSIHKYLTSTWPEHIEFYSVGPTPYTFHDRYRFEFYGPKAITHHSVPAISALDGVLDSVPEVLWYHRGNTVPADTEWPAFHDHCTLLYQSYPPSIAWFNPFDWQGSMRPASVYRCRRTPGAQAGATSHSPATALRSFEGESGEEGAGTDG